MCHIWPDVPHLKHMPEYAFRDPPEENQEISEKISKIGK